MTGFALAQEKEIHHAGYEKGISSVKHSVYRWYFPKNLEFTGSWRTVFLSSCSSSREYKHYTSRHGAETRQPIPKTHSTLRLMAPTEMHTHQGNSMFVKQIKEQNWTKFYLVQDWVTK